MNLADLILRDLGFESIDLGMVVLKIFNLVIKRNL